MAGAFLGIAFGDKIHWVHFGEVRFGVRVRRVRLSGSLFWSGFVRYVLRGPVLGQGFGGYIFRDYISDLFPGRTDCAEHQTR